MFHITGNNRPAVYRLILWGTTLGGTIAALSVRPADFSEMLFSFILDWVFQTQQHTPIVLITWLSLLISWPLLFRISVPLVGAANLFLVVDGVYGLGNACRDGGCIFGFFIILSWLTLIVPLPTMMWLLRRLVLIEAQFGGFGALSLGVVNGIISAAIAYFGTWASPIIVPFGLTVFALFGVLPMLWLPIWGIKRLIQGRLAKP